MPTLTLNQYRNLSKAGKLCGIVGCENKPTNCCPRCYLFYCDRDFKIHFHVASGHDQNGLSF